MSSNSSSDDESDRWQELNEEGSNQFPLICLVCAHSSQNTVEFFSHLNGHKNWTDFLNQESCHIHDQYDWIRFVNFVRSQHPPTWQEVFSSEAWKSGSEKLMFPVIPDDPVLALDIESILEEQNESTLNKGPSQTNSNGLDHHDCHPCSSDLANIQAENQFLRQQLTTCKRLLSKLSSSEVTGAARLSVCPTSESEFVNPVACSDPSDSAYFCSYGHFAIHAEMINDIVRTESYRNFILSNAHTHFAGKTVLDVGCGSGILSLFASEAGATHVYGVEASVDIFAAAQETVIANHLSDRITLLRDCAENVKLPVDRVDVIISEWMGYFLLFESMLDSVIQVALRCLTPAGHIYPRHYSLCLLGISCGQKLRHDCVDLWDNVYGFQMPTLRRAALTEAHILDVSDPRVIGPADAAQGFRILTSKPCQLYSLDLDIVLKQRRNQPISHWSDLQSAEGPIDLWVDSTLDESATYQLDAFVGYFDVQFDEDAPNPVSFSTSPTSRTTHWKQTVFFLDKPITVKSGDHLTGNFKVRRAIKDVRGLECSLQLSSLHGQPAVHQLFSMDYSCFFDPGFSQKQWINSALDSAVREQNVDRKASELALELHVQMKDAMQTVDRSIQEAIHSIPRVLREVESLRIDAMTLGSELQNTKEHLSQIQMDSQPTMSQLIELDRSRRNAQQAANALRETARWSELVREIDEVLEAKDLSQLCATIEGMESCLTALTHLPDYNERLALVGTHKNSLESLLAPQLMQAFNELQAGLIDSAQSAEELRHLIDLFYRIGRPEAARNYFTSCLKIQVSQLWDQCTKSTAEDLRNLPVPILQTVEQLVASANTNVSEFGETLPGMCEQRVEKYRQFATFVAHLIRLCENQIAQIGYSTLMDKLKTYQGHDSLSPADTVTPNLTDIQIVCDNLARAFVTPFRYIGLIFASQCRLRFSEQLNSIKLTWDNPNDAVEGPSNAVSQSMQLLSQASTFCLEETYGLCLPPLLDVIQTYWEGLAAKWLVAVEQFSKQLTILDNSAAYNQANFFSSALQLASITGELSTRADALVDNLLLQSSEHLSEWLQTGNVISLPTGNTIAFVRQLAWVHPDTNQQQALHCLANSSLDVTRSTPSSTANPSRPGEPHTHTSQCRVTAVHQANVRMCRATVTMVRRVALTPIGQYLLALPESFEPYMDANYHPRDADEWTVESPEDLVSSHGLAECLRLGYPDAVSVSLNRSEQVDQDPSLSGSTQRKRLISHGQTSVTHKSGETPDSAALCWLETLVSGVACDLLVSAVLKIESCAAIYNRRPDSAEESEDFAVLTEHGAKQLQVDLDYFRNLLDDLGLPLTGNLKALCDLIQCPGEEFANLSASRPPRIVNAVAKLRGI
ncbi:Protein arginine N-methyltransferase 3 [Fasciola hepatica]|uniref:type I protein arginine methyltransferase n=1 Tax=Fasciola hepatica TaxID=6192 RepID=A0A4E0S3I0_FASHE|nr:Protein arginine N-methyltransferase 3 [Fasciola hepatica]